jgi:ribosomal protein S18 acetylase RimI-like enzyme
VIRRAEDKDRDAIWRILEPILRAGEVFAFPADWSREQALGYWFAPSHEVFVFEDTGAVLGSYYLRANQQGGGDHVANAGFMTANHAGGRGIARQMCAHSIERARERGFQAMQFNFVVASNAAAVALWHKMGFETIGRLPGAFRHPRDGYTDALVMFRQL